MDCFSQGSAVLAITHGGNMTVSAYRPSYVGILNFLFIKC